MIQFDQVTKKYPNGHQALSQVSFSIEPGQIAFLTGHSGAGKSTLLKLIMLLEKPSQGSLLVNKQNIAHLKSRQVPFYRRQIGMVHQNHQLLFDRSVFDNVALPLVVSGYQSNEIGRRVRAALDKVGLLSKERLNPINLSGGEQQRVGIARAVVNKPSILLADEPTGNLDPDLSADTMDLFMQFSRVGVAVLIASHDTALIERYKHRRLVLDKGRLLGEEAR
ncbi:MAG: cell division ATP-binding protein FtsE [Gammaproteobacteria bacterium]|nr:MAG: cell division ATP-binding protein FtsE [Gammaproteobacteria bacterium]